MSKRKQKKVNSKVLMQQKRRRRQFITFGRILKYGANSFLRNAWLSVAATAVMTITLLIIFGSVIARTVLIDTVDEIKDKVDMSIYVKQDIPEEDLAKMEKSIEGLESVKDVRYISPEEARKNFASKNSDDDSIRQALIEAENQFFGILNVKLVDIGDTSELEALVKNDKLIQDNLDKDHPPSFASDRKEIINNIANSVNFAEKVGLIAGLIFTIIASLIIFNTIRMAIFNRREEIYMMKLIGANKSFIRGPFIVEAVICGTLAAFLATGLGYGVMYFAKTKLEAYGIAVQPAINFLNSYFILVLLGMILVGSVIGMVSSLTATRKYLKI